MVYFAIDLEVNKESVKFMEDFIKRGQNVNWVTNPFHIDTVGYGQNWIIKIEPIYPNISVYGLMLLVGVYAFVGFNFSYLYIPGIFVASSHILFTKQFYFFFLKQGLRKAGFKGKVTLLSDDKNLERCFSWAKKKSMNI